ncbi:MAG: hypothetical protein J7507_03515 [Pseudoxanthomonas sp.]|nr:hypothetical protein [Pseudoxanthomonas sp.]
MDTKRLIAAILLVSAGSIASAEEIPAAPAACVDLGPDRDIVRHGDTSLFTLRDGGTRYLVALRGTCNSMRSAQTVSIRTRGVDGRLCPHGTTVQTRHDICTVKRFEQIDASAPRGSEARDAY